MKKFVVDENCYDRLATLIDQFAPKTAKGKAKHAAFAKAAGISAGTWDRIFNKKQKPRLEDLMSLSRATGVSLEWLAAGKGEMFKDVCREQEATYFVSTVSVSTERGFEILLKGEHKEVVELLKSAAEILMGEDRGTAKALKENILSFHEKIEKIKSLEKRIEALEKVLNRRVPSGEAKET